MADHPPPARPAESRAYGGPLALAAVTLGLLTWPIAFNLGAYGEIFYTNVFQVVVASTILLVVAVVDDSTSSRWNWSVRVALAAPMVWLLAAGYLVGSTSEALDRPGFAVSLVVILCCSVPLTLRLLVKLSMPELSQAGSRRILLSIVTLVAVVGAIGYLVGREHPRFMTCADFSVAGAAEPEGCAR
ncbi:hypothetical protein [Ilumatobacter sp.]|uniref:hypothetical protein n=1 Tax=Ilumatobacter sp. TaxID=1967498 RepID=UPI003AF95B5D